MMPQPTEEDSSDEELEYADAASGRAASPHSPFLGMFMPNIFWHIYGFRMGRHVFGNYLCASFWLHWIKYLPWFLFCGLSDTFICKCPLNFDV